MTTKTGPLMLLTMLSVQFIRFVVVDDVFDVVVVVIGDIVIVVDFFVKLLCEECLKTSFQLSQCFLCFILTIKFNLIF
jgi:hypothetical protein